MNLLSEIKNIFEVGTVVLKFLVSWTLHRSDICNYINKN